MSILQALYESHTFSNLHFVLVVIHVTLALVALALGPVAMRVHKGGLWHRRAGKVYLWSMVISLVAAILLLFYRFNPFLAGITALSLNGVVTGVRSLARKRPGAGVGPIWFDWTFAVTIFVSGIALIGFGATVALGLAESWIPSGSGSFVVLAVLPVVFGILSANDARIDLRSFRNPSNDRNWWWYYHIERMCGSYIALFTALMVQQVGPRLPAEIAWIVWVAPAAIGSPLISIWIKQYRVKFASRSSAHLQPLVS